MWDRRNYDTTGNVAPYTGAWIEIVIIIDVHPPYESHPTRVRGLKYHHVSLLVLF